MVRALLCTLSMIRITTVSRNQGAVTVRVEGQLTASSVPEVSSTCHALTASGWSQVELDLSGVTFADRTGTELLQELTSGGARLVSCSAFLEQMLETGCVERRAEKPASIADESDFISQLRAGDSEAFEKLVRQFGGRMLAVARRFLSNEHDAQDAVQEAFVSAFQAIDQFQGGAMLSTWLHRIVVNAALMQLRRRKRKPETSIDELMPRFDADGNWAGGEVCTDSTNGTAPLEQRDTRELVQRCIAQLPESYRTILLMRDIEDLDTAETAKSLGISTNIVKVRLHRARQALRTLIEREASSDEIANRRESGIEAPNASAA